MKYSKSRLTNAIIIYIDYTVKFAINAEKTNVFAIDTRMKKDKYNRDLIIEGPRIEWKDEVKYVEAHIERKLTYKRNASFLYNIIKQKKHR